MATEEERAAIYHQQAQALEDAALRRYRALAGQASAYAARVAAMAALRRDEGWEPVERMTAEDRDGLGN